MEIDKRELFNLVIENIEMSLLEIKGYFEGSKKDVIEAEGRMKTRYDTTRTERAWLADAYSKRYEETLLQLDLLRKFDLPLKKDCVQIGSFVCLENLADIKHSYYFILPVAGGMKLECKRKEITVISPQAPLTKLILGKNLYDEISLKINRTNKEYCIDDMV